MKAIVLIFISIIILSCNSDQDKLLEDNDLKYRNIYIGQSYKDANKSYDLAYKDLMNIKDVNADTMLISNSVEVKYSFYTFSEKEDWYRSIYFEINGDTVSSIQEIDKEGSIFVESLSLIPEGIYIPKTDY